MNISQRFDVWLFSKLLISKHEGNIKMARIDFENNKKVDNPFRKNLLNRLTSLEKDGVKE